MKHTKLVAQLLKMASREFSNHGCNDFTLDNSDENWQLIEDMNRWNSDDPEDWDTRPPLNKPIYTMDWCLMSYLSHLAEQMPPAHPPASKESYEGNFVPVQYGPVKSRAY